MSENTHCKKPFNINLYPFKKVILTAPRLISTLSATILLLI